MRTYKDVNKLPNGPLDPSKKKLYNNMWRKYKKLFRKHAKDICPYDYLFGLEPFVDFLRWMKEYYELGYNVWGMEHIEEDPEFYKGTPTRAESLRETIRYYDLWQNCEDSYFKVVLNEDEL